MVELDLFGLEGERRINKSGVREIFTPHQPIMSITHFFGRQREVSALVGYLNTPGQHALLFGNRGVGKSSLANATVELILSHFTSGEIIKKRCDSEDDFVSVVGVLLTKYGIDVSEKTQTKTITKGASHFINLGKTKTTENFGANDLASSPSWVARKLAHVEGVFVIDEVDALNNVEDKKKLAELIKHLSDEGSKLKILLVGIAETSAELTAGHQSVSRCLKEVKLENMKISELKEIILKGAAALKLRFESRVVNKIVNLSSGYPHFTHLLALKAAEEAIVEERKEVTYDDLVVALGKSIDDAEGTLRATYNLAIRSASEEYKKILLALSICPDEEIRARDIRNKYQELFKTEISQGTLNNYFQRLVSDDDSAILRRLAQGIYRFNDPRMPSFIKIVQSYLD